MADGAWAHSIAVNLGRRGRRRIVEDAMFMEHPRIATRATCAMCGRPCRGPSLPICAAFGLRAAL